MEGQCASAYRAQIIRGTPFVVSEIVAPQGFPVCLAEDATGVVLQLPFLPQQIACCANCAPDRPSWDRRLFEAIAVEADDGSPAVAVGDRVHSTDVEFRRQLNGDGQFIACEGHLPSPPLVAAEEIKSCFVAFVTVRLSRLSTRLSSGWSTT